MADWRQIIMDACKLAGEHYKSVKRRKPLTPKAIRRTFYLDLRNSIQRGVREALRKHGLRGHTRMLAYFIIFQAVRDIFQYGPEEALIQHYVKRLERTVII